MNLSKTNRRAVGYRVNLPLSMSTIQYYITETSKTYQLRHTQDRGNKTRDATSLK